MDELIDALENHISTMISWEAGDPWCYSSHKKQSREDFQKALNNFVELKVREMLLPHLNALHKLPDGWSVDL